MVESFVILNAAGGERLGDVNRLRADPGLAEMLGHEILLPEAGRKFLYQFRDEGKIEEVVHQRELGKIAHNERFKMNGHPRTYHAG